MARALSSGSCGLRGSSGSQTSSEWSCVLSCCLIDLRLPSIGAYKRMGTGLRLVSGGW